MLVAAALAICGFAAAAWLWRDRPPATGVAILDGLEPQLRALHVHPPADREPNLALELPLIPEVMQVPEGTPTEGMIAFRNAGKGPLTILALAALDERIRMRVEVGGSPYTFGAPIEAGAEGEFIYEVSPLRGDRTVCLSVEVLTNDPHFIASSSGAFGRTVIDLRVRARSSVIVRALDGVVTERGIALGSFFASTGTECRVEIRSLTRAPIEAVESKVSDERLHIELVSSEPAPSRQLRIALLGPLPEGRVSLDVELALHFSDGTPSAIKSLFVFGSAEPDLYFSPRTLMIHSRGGGDRRWKVAILARPGIEIGVPEVLWVTAGSPSTAPASQPAADELIETQVLSRPGSDPQLEIRLRPSALQGIASLELVLPATQAGRRMEARLPIMIHISKM